MSKRVFFICLLYFMFLILLAFGTLKVVARHYYFHVTFSEQNVIDISFTQKEIKIPTEQDLLSIKDTYNNISSCFGSSDNLKMEIIEIYNNVLSAKVCSTTNKYFNQLEEKYNEYLLQINIVEKNLVLFEDEYNNYLNLLSNIPLYSMSLRIEKYNEFSTIVKPLYQTVYNEKKQCLTDKDEITNMYLTSKQLADDLYNKDFDLMCRLVNAEGRGCSAEEQYRIANTVENRIKHWYFPNTLRNVIYSPGQYECVTNNSINLNPTAFVKQNMKIYLRGNVETGMPDDVVYQAKHRQGDVWYYSEESGHYFCRF